VLVDPLQSKYDHGNGRWQVKSLSTSLRQLRGRQIDATFTSIAKDRQASTVTLRPIPGTPTAAAPVSQPPVSPDFPNGTELD
jgi:hypothetical protein